MANKRAHKDIRSRLMAGVEFDPFGGCWLWSEGGIGAGYGQLCFGGEKGTTHRMSHRAFVGPIPDGLYVLHKCDVRRCINPAHLYLGTHLDNQRDATMRHRQRSGESHHAAKLRTADVMEMRAIPWRPYLWPFLAKTYGVSETAARHAYIGVAWAHLPMPGRQP